MVLGRSQRSAVLLAALLGGCGVRTPPPLDTQALVRARTPAGARAELELRVLDDPRDVQARAALAKLAEEAGRPSQAIEQLEAVLGLGGLLGPRWRAEDRARLARLLAARGQVRLARGAASALADLTRARALGAAVAADDLARARAAVALVHLRHVDAAERARGHALLAELVGSSVGDPSWRGAKPGASPDDRGRYGLWLWTHGARRAGWEALRGWYETARVRGGALHDAYLRAYAWWTPLDAPAPPAADLVGPERCRFSAAAGCEPSRLVGTGILDLAAVAPLLAAPVAPTSRTDDASAWTSITLWQALRGEGGWGRALTARVDPAAIGAAPVPPHVRAALARLSGGTGAAIGDRTLGQLAPHERLVVAAIRALDGDPVARVRAALGELAETEAGRALLEVAQPPIREALPAPRAAAVTAFVRARGHDLPSLARLLEGYRRDPAIADRLARDAVAEAADDAAAHAALGSMFDALGDPARARAAWQAAVDASPEPGFVLGLADAAARANDPDAALVHATTAAAAWGDPAIAWIQLARILEGVGEHVHALEAARSALDLAGRDDLAAALEVAIAASRALGRAEQADALAARRAQLAPATSPVRDGDPTDAAAALAAYHAQPGSSTQARLWVASRWNPRDVASRAALLASIGRDDPRRAVLATELVGLAGDRDPSIGRAAVAALR